MYGYLLHERMQFSSWNLSLEFHEVLNYASHLTRKEGEGPGEQNLVQNSPKKINNYFL